MQYKDNTKIIIDKRKLDVLIRLGCPDEQLLELVKTGNFTPTGDDLIDETLECLVDIKHFSNWGGFRKGSGKKPKKNNILNQVENQLENQVANQEINQVVDKDKDKDKDKDNRYGELNNVRLTDIQYKNLSEKYKNLDLAIEKLDTWLGTSGMKNRNRNHYAYFKSNSWVWENLKPKNTEMMF